MHVLLKFVDNTSSFLQTILNKLFFSETFFVLFCLLFITSDESYNEDVEWIRQIKQGNNDVYGKLFKKYFDKIYRYCYWILYQHSRSDPVEDAKDIASKALERCYVNIYKLRNNRAFCKWLHKTAFNICMDMLNKPEPQPIPEDKPSLIPTPEESEKKNKIQEVVREAIKDLRKRYREAVIYVHFEGLSYEETAKIMNCKVGDVKNYVHRGMIKLKDKLINYKYLIE